MRVITTADGLPACFHCGRVFDRHPTEVEREKQLSLLRGIENDDYAARAFHHYREMQAWEDALTKIWVNHFGLHSPSIGFIRLEGIGFSIEPGVTTEQLMAEIENNFIPMIRDEIRKTLDGTREREIRAFSASEHKSQPSVWCPERPAVDELYPNGYTRHADGTIEAIR